MIAPKIDHPEMRKKRRIRIVLLSFLVCSFFSVLLYFYITRTVPEFNQYRLVRSYPAPSTSKGPRTILLWNDFFGDKLWRLPSGTLAPDDFRDALHCPVYQCELSINHNYLPSIHMFDAIVFHTAQPFPFLNPIPKRRSAHQLYVFASMESPGETKHILNDEIDFYNLTMTYRLDSDIIWPYMYVQDIETGALVAPAKYPNWRKPPNQWNDTELMRLWSRKTNNAAWFVSHCKTLSKREKLAESLQRYIDVDIFGKCGPKRCQRDSPECDEMLDNKYRFYLSFENALCVDYVTEKLFNAMQRFIIPVVFGGAAGAKYTRFVPPQSYINAEDFASVEELAKYLKYLTENPAEYMRYFWWRQFYRFTYHNPFCDLCERLHDLNRLERVQTYHDIEKWWIGGSCRFDAKIKF